MAHIPTVVSIPTSVRNVKQEVERLLAPYDRAITLEPYKVRPSQQQIQEMVNFYRTDNLEELVQH